MEKKNSQTRNEHTIRKETNKHHKKITNKFPDNTTLRTNKQS